MSDVIGAMRARVTLQRPIRVAGEIGGAAIAWIDEGEVWAEIEVDGAGESRIRRGSFDEQLSRLDPTLGRHTRRLACAVGRARAAHHGRARRWPAAR